MSEDFSDKVRALLEDPEMVAKIAAIAGGLGGGTQPAPSTESPKPETPKPEAEQTAALPAPVKLPDALKPDPRLALINSLKPFMRSERQAKLDSLTKAFTLASLMGTLGKDKDKKV